MKEQRLVEARCSGKNWRDEYQRKLVSADEAVKVVKSGDRVIVPLPVNLTFWDQRLLPGRTS